MNRYIVVIRIVGLSAPALGIALVNSCGPETAERLVHEHLVEQMATAFRCDRAEVAIGVLAHAIEWSEIAADSVIWLDAGGEEACSTIFDR